MIFGCQYEEKKTKPAEPVIEKTFSVKAEINESLAVEILLDEYDSWEDLIARVEQIACDDSIPKITIASSRKVKNIYFNNRCWEKNGPVRINVCSTVEIQNDSIYSTKHSGLYPIDSLKTVILNKVDSNTSKTRNSPEKLLYYICYTNEDFDKFAETLDKITDGLERMTGSTIIDLILVKRTIIPPPPEEVSTKPIISDEPLYNFEFYLPHKMEEWYSNNHEKEVESREFTLASIYSSADVNSEVVGKLTGNYDPEVGNYILRFKSADGITTREYNEIGDWGYGIHMNVKALSGDFVLLPTAYFDREAWISTEYITGYTSSYVGELVSLPDITVIEKESEQIVDIEMGVYWIEAMHSGEYLIRKEVPSDMPCGDEVESIIDEKELPRYFLDINDLMLENGDINIEVAYKRGC